MSASIQVVFNHFPALAGQLEGVLETALDMGVAAAIATADQHARVDTGAMRANKTIARSAGGRVVTWNEEHSVYNELGTYKMSAQPFAGPGMDAAVPVVEAHLGRLGR